jgi:transcriptional regulator with XRE-family HTH domain
MRLPTITLYAIRLKAGYATQARLAARLGMSRTNYGRIERGRQEPNPHQVLRLALLLHVPVKQLREVFG